MRTIVQLTAAFALLLAPAALVQPAYGQYDYGDTYGYYDEEPEVGFYENGEYETEESDDVEYEPGEGYHEEEWYDPSDWFDVDEGIEYEYDGGYYYDGYYDDDWYYDYYDEDYNYGW